MLRNVHPNFSLHQLNFENRENRSVFEQNVDEVYVHACALVVVDLFLDLFYFSFRF